MPPKKPLVTDSSFPINAVMRRVKRQFKTFPVTTLASVAETSRDPFRVLISCIISLRTKDAVTAEASARLYELAKTPGEMKKLAAARISKAIFPAGFYKTKAKQIREIARRIDEEHGGKVPDEIDALLELKGVGRNTANLVVGLGYGKPSICVDTHVHRITNRWGYVETRNPDETERALREGLPRRHWIAINDLLVTWGQNICAPVSPKCSECSLASDDLCRRVGVERSR